MIKWVNKPAVSATAPCRCIIVSTRRDAWVVFQDRILLMGAGGCGGAVPGHHRPSSPWPPWRPYHHPSCFSSTPFSPPASLPSNKHLFNSLLPPWPPPRKIPHSFGGCCKNCGDNRCAPPPFPDNQLSPPNAQHELLKQKRGKWEESKDLDRSNPPTSPRGDKRPDSRCREGFTLPPTVDLGEVGGRGWRGVCSLSSDPFVIHTTLMWLQSTLLITRQNVHSIYIYIFFNSLIYITINPYLPKNRQLSAMQLTCLPWRRHKVQFVKLSNFTMEAAATEYDHMEFKPALASGAPLALEDSVCNGFSSTAPPNINPFLASPLPTFPHPTTHPLPPSLPLSPPSWYVALVISVSQGWVLGAGPG